MTDESIFASALEKPDPAERAAYLVSACAGDPEQRARVEALLAAHVRAGDFLEGPADGPAPALGVTWRRGDPPPEEAEEPFTFLEPTIRADAIGRLGHYEVLQVVGRGGFGIVFRAFDDVLQRVVAIKVMSPRMAETSPARKRFVREARAYAAVRHENVVQVYAIEEQPIPYLVMEFIPGGTLEGVLGKTGPLDATDVVRIGVQLARGLAAAHAIGLIHRDVKPANILIENGPDRRVKITDFGLARAADDASLTQSGMIAGTPMYMAPEQAHGTPLDHRADLFSLGSVLYEMCTGRAPFRAPTTLAVLKRVAEEDPRPIRDIIPETPQGLCDVIEKLHAKNPDRRFQSATELADALSRCLSDETVLLTPIKPTLVADEPPSEPARPRSARANPARAARPVPWLALTLLGGLLLVVGVAFAVYALPTKKPASDPQAGLPPLTPPPLLPFPPLPAPPARSHALGDFLASPDWEWSAPENLGPGVNTAGRELSATLTSDELTLVFARNQKLWISRRGSIGEPFAKAELLPDAINTQFRETPSLSGDGLLLAFVSAQERGREEVWLSERKSLDEPFGDPVRLPEPVNGAAWVVGPILSPDGLTLLVTTLRPGGPGSGDIVMYAREKRTEPFGNETVLPAPVNSPTFDTAAWVSDDGRVLVRTRMEKDKPFETRFHVRPAPGAPFGPARVLSSLELHGPWLSPDGMRMYFHSREIPGGHGDLDLWVCRRVPKKK